MRLCPFSIIIDTREQTPFSFLSITVDQQYSGVRSKPQSRQSQQSQHIQIGQDATDAETWTIPMIRGTLQQGDYGIEGMAARVAVERKSAADLFGTLSSGRKRFVRELERLQERCEFAAVVVEADWQTLFSTPPEYSRLPPRNVFRSVVAYQQRYPRVHWWFCPGRRFAELTTFRVLERFWREDEERRRKTATDAGMTGTIMRVDVGGPPKGRHVFPQETDGKKKEEKGGGE
jgi:hypothetical protein